MKTMKKLWILMAALTATLLLCVISASACTMVYVGSDLTDDGSSFMARSEERIRGLLRLHPHLHP